MQEQCGTHRIRGQLALECQLGTPRALVLALNTAVDLLEVGGVSVTGRNLFRIVYPSALGILRCNVVFHSHGHISLEGNDISRNCESGLDMSEAWWRHVLSTMGVCRHLLYGLLFFS